MEETYKEPLLGFETAFHSLLHRNEFPRQNQNLVSSCNESTSVSSQSQGQAPVVSPTAFPSVMLHHSTSKGSDSTVTVTSPTTFFEETDNGPCQVMISGLSQRTAAESTSNIYTQSSVPVLAQQSVNDTDLQIAYTSGNFGRFNGSHTNNQLIEGSHCTTQGLRSLAVTDPSLINTQVTADTTMQSNFPTNHTISAASSHNNLSNTQVGSSRTLQLDQTTSQAESVQVESPVDNIEIIFYSNSEDNQQTQMNSSANSLDFDLNTSLTSALATAVNNADSISHDIDENVLSQNPTIHHILNNEPISNILDQFESRIDESNTLKKKLLECVKDKSRFAKIIKSDKRSYTKPDYSRDKSYCGLNFRKTCACLDSVEREEVPEDQVFIVQGQMYRLQEATVIKIGHLQMHAFLRNGSLYVPMCILWQLLDIDSQKHLKKAFLKNKSSIKCEELLENDLQLVKQKYDLSLKNTKQKMIDVVGVRALAKSIVTEHDNDILNTLAYQPFMVKVCSSDMKCTQCGGIVSKLNNSDDYVTLDLSSFQTEDDNCTQDVLNNKSTKSSLEKVDVTIGALYLHKTKFAAFELKNKIHISVKEFVAYKILPLEKLQNKLEKLQYRPIIAPPEVEILFLQSDPYVCKSLWMSLDKVIAVCKTSYCEDSKRHDLLLHFTMQSFFYEASIQTVASDTSMSEDCNVLTEDRSHVGVKVENMLVRNQSCQISNDEQSKGKSESNLLLEQYENTLQDFLNKCQEGSGLQQIEKNSNVNHHNVTILEAVAEDNNQSLNTEENNFNEEIAGREIYVTDTYIETTQTDRIENRNNQTTEIVEKEVVLNSDSEFMNDSSNVQQDSSVACQDKYDTVVDKTLLVTEEEYIVRDIELFKQAVLEGKVQCCSKNDPSVVNTVRYSDLHLAEAVTRKEVKYSEQLGVGREALKSTLPGTCKEGQNLSLKTTTDMDVSALSNENISTDLAPKEDKCQSEILTENNKNIEMTYTGKHLTDSSAWNQQNQSDKENCDRQGKHLVMNEVVVSTDSGFLKNVTCMQNASAVCSGKNNDDTDQSVLLSGEEYVVQNNDMFKNSVDTGQIKSYLWSNANTVRYSDHHQKLVGIEDRKKCLEKYLSQQEKAIQFKPTTSDTEIDHLQEQDLSNDGKHERILVNKSPVKTEKTEQSSSEANLVIYTEFNTVTSPVTSPLKSPASRVEKICSKIASMMVPNATNDPVSPLNMLATVATTEEIGSDLECEAENESGNVVNSVSRQQLKYSEEERSAVEEKIKQYIVFAPRGKYLVVKRFKEGAAHAFPALFSPYPDHPMAKDARRKFIAAVSLWVNAKFSNDSQSEENEGKASPDCHLDMVNKFSQPASKKDLTRGECIEGNSKDSNLIGKDNYQKCVVEQLETVPCGDKGNKVSELCVDQTPVGSNTRPDGVEVQTDLTNSLTKTDRPVCNSNKVSYETNQTKDYDSSDLERSIAETLDDSTGMEDKSMQSDSNLADCSSVSTSSCNMSGIGAVLNEKTATESEDCDLQCESCPTNCKKSQTECGSCTSKFLISAAKFESSKSGFKSCSTGSDSSQTECESCTSECVNSVTNCESSKSRYERCITDCDSSGSGINTGITECETTGVKQSSKKLRRKSKESNCKETEKRGINVCKTESGRGKGESDHCSSLQIPSESNISVEKESFSKKRKRKFDKNENIREKKRRFRSSSENRKDTLSKSNEDTSDIASDNTTVSELKSETNASLNLTSEDIMDKTSQKSEPSYKIRVKLKSSKSKHTSQNGVLTKKSSKTKIKEGNNLKSTTKYLDMKKLSKEEDNTAKQKDNALEQPVKSSLKNNKLFGNKIDDIGQISSSSVIPRRKINKGSKSSRLKPKRVGKGKLNEASNELKNESTEVESDVDTKVATEARSTRVMQVATDNVVNEASEKGSCEIEIKFKTLHHIQNKSQSPSLNDRSHLRKTRSDCEQNCKQKMPTNNSKQIHVLRKENNSRQQKKSVTEQSATGTALCSNADRIVIDKEHSKLVSPSSLKLGSKLGSRTGEQSMKRKALADLCYVKLKRIKLLDDVFRK